MAKESLYLWLQVLDKTQRAYQVWAALSRACGTKLPPAHVFIARRYLTI